MKKTILIVALLLGSVISMVAQSRAIGLRSFQEISYQHSLGSSNMFQLDAGVFGYPNTGIQATGIYNWMFPISWDYEGSWNWYVGPGASVGMKNSGAFVGVSGMIGIEYNFWFPLQLSIDYRPIIPLVGSRYLPFSVYYSNTVGVGVRYLF